jgi:hypothetical protein
LYGALASDSPPPGATVLDCVLISGQSDLPVIVGISSLGKPVNSLAALVTRTGYQEAVPAEQWQRFRAPLATLPGVSISCDWVLADRHSSWQWQVANLVVNLVLALQPEFLFFHAGAVNLGGRGVLLLGASGRGKTSVALALAGRGHVYYGDEIGAVRAATRELVPIPRSAMVRAPEVLGADPAARIRVTVDRHPRYPVALAGLICLRAFADRTVLTRSRPTSDMLGLITPMSCSLASRGPAQLALDLLRLIEDIPCYVLDSASPASAAEAIEAALMS